MQDIVMFKGRSRVRVMVPLVLEGTSGMGSHITGQEYQAI